MTQIYLVRHAQAEGNLFRRIHGWYDSPVTQTGKQQIAALEHRFQGLHIDAVYTSDLQRTQATAQAVLRSRDLELQIDPGLREIGMGIYEDATFGDLAYHHPDQCRLFITCSPDWTAEEGESFQQVSLRMSAAFSRIAQRHPGQTVALFSHGTAIRCLQSALRGKHPSETPELGHCENTAVSLYEVEGDRFRICFENDASHLANLAPDPSQGQFSPAQSPVPQVWFQSLDMERDSSVYTEARKDAWINIHGSLLNFDGPGFLSEAREQSLWDRRAVQRVMLEGETVGVLQLATLRGAQEGIGYVPFVYLRSPCRCRGIGVQLIGQAVCTYRAMGRKRLRLRCAPDNAVAQRFYQRCGFVKIGQAPGTRVPLDLLEREI